MEEEKVNNLDDDSEAQAIAKQDPFTAKPLKGESIKVAVRIRPLNALEKEKNELNCTEYNLQEKTISIGATGPPSATGKMDYRTHTFAFDHVFPTRTTNEEVYESLCKPILDSAFSGVHGAVLCYGQTGAGKTYTMFGEEQRPETSETKHEKDTNDVGDLGIVPRMLSELFQKISLAGKDTYQFDVRMTILEIYQDKIYDLISGSKKCCTLIGGANNTPGSKKNKYVSKIKRAGISVDGATEVEISYASTALKIIKNAAKNRITHETKMNSQSSRSHCVVIISIAKSNLLLRTTTLGQLYLVDLAGSEKVSKTGAMGMRLDEAKRINKSLLTLGIVIDKLIKKSRHVPYRDSNLTRLLQNCLGGNSRCALCVNISPSSWHYGESMSTLYFGCRTRSIKNKPKSNKFLSAAQLRENLKKYNVQIQENRKTISQLDTQLGDVREFFDIIRNSKEAAALCDFLCCERFNLKCPRGLQEFKTNKNECGAGDRHDYSSYDDGEEKKCS
eukprot:g5780.t1